ncbi:ABC transporter permease [Aequorivita lipolytica]|uniref:FtsX-like permease family protein n=1 Tax=Aequorivita lipolytica TaxID=153267 RepID=A0A5C6YNP9_9FLAO|nr:ABC transporter permease [Aequorivita lipolytica]TXD68963.1 FtsX-like permease family protein [Aequorivita lipolytica]SRX53052.1 putative ABC transporter permease YknZ [Aequorivita lipolytica]
MIRNYIKIAWRSLQKNKLQTVINLLGLTVGTVCCLSILIHVIAQFGYDKQFADSSSIYRLNTIINENEDGAPSAGVSPPIAFAMKEDFPEVKEVCRVVYFGEGNDGLLRNPESDEAYYETRGYLADSTFFKMFNYPFVEGNPEGSLSAPNSIVLSETLAKKLFGSKKALNKTLVLGSGAEEQTLTIKGVFKEDFGKSHLNPNYILTMDSGGFGRRVMEIQNFATQNFTMSYLRLKSGANTSHLEAKFPEFLQRHGAKDLAAVGFSKSLSLQKVTDIHLFSKGIRNQIGTVSDINYLYMLLILALFIQLVACINFINLSTARANKRAKEIGVRKAIGAEKGDLVRQFLGESILLSLFASILSIPFTAIALPFVNTLTQGDIGYSNLLDWRILVALLILGILTGLIAGLYPALILSSIKPVKVLKSSVNLNLGNGYLRKALVVFQFVVSIGLISVVIIITQQVKFSQKMDMGFDKENLIAVRLGTQNVSEKFSTIQSNFRTIKGIKQVAGTNYYPSEKILGDMGMTLPGGNPADQTLVIYNGVSPNYLETVGTSLLAGRTLRDNDENQILVNKAALDAFQIPLDKAVGLKIIQTYEGEVDEFEIVGVTADYNFASLKEEVKPILLYNENTPDWIILKAETQNYEALLNTLESSWKTINPNTPFVFNFVDKEVEKLYAEEKRLGKISVLFTSLAILISCLGLFGLVSFVAEQKKKEIGIRKVLGASVQNMVRLLTKDFVRLVGIAFIIAAPLAYFIMQNWLQDFPYRINIEWWVFLIAGGAALIITLLTVSFQAIKAAIANPVKSLRTE